MMVTETPRFLGLQRRRIEAVNKTELIDAVATHTGNAKSTVAEVLAGLEDVVVATVSKGEKVALTGFVSFDRVDRKARTARNPQTGAAIQVKASKAPKVAAGASFKKVVKGEAPAPSINK
jgi:DNA-binding protein HU-beta